MTDREVLDLILQKVSDLDDKVNRVEDKVNNLESDIQELKQEVQGINLTLENEIRVNIQRVAEGHLDLSRKLNESIRISSDIKDKQEIQDIFFNMYNNKLKVMVNT